MDEFKLYALCYLHDWDVDAEGKQKFFPEVSGLFFSFKEAEDARLAKSEPGKYWVRSARLVGDAKLAQAVSAKKIGMDEVCAISDEMLGSVGVGRDVIRSIIIRTLYAMNEKGLVP